MVKQRVAPDFRQQERPLSSAACRMPDLNLRPFCLADAERVEPWFDAPGLALPPGAAAKDWAARMLADPRIVAAVAEAGGRPIGFLRLDIGPDRVAEMTLVVARARRRRGVGRWILDAAMPLLRARGVRRLRAVVDRQNHPGLQFFAEMGFEEEAQVGAVAVALARLVHTGPNQQPLEIEV
jgi:GNAT superfamily N-acetyltransferase